MFCQLQPQLPQIMEEDEDLQVRRATCAEAVSTSRCSLELSSPKFRATRMVQRSRSVSTLTQPMLAVLSPVECAEWLT